MAICCNDTSYQQIFEIFSSIKSGNPRQTVLQGQISTPAATAPLTKMAQGSFVAKKPKKSKISKIKRPKAGKLFILLLL